MASVPVPAPFALPKPVAAQPAPASAPKAVAPNGYFWKGADGNVYVQGGSGINSAGQWNAQTANYWAQHGFVQTPDSPVQQGGGANTTQNITGVGGSGGVVGPVAPTDAEMAPILASMSQLDTILGNKNDQSNNEYGTAIAGYDAQDKLDQNAITQNRTQNETNLTSDDWKALLNAANGATGLRGTLASLGALSGSGAEVVRHLTGLAANSDQGNARKTFDTNAGQISQSAAQVEQQEKQRRLDAKATLDNNIQNNQATVLTSRQGLYQKLADLWGAGTSQGNSYAAQAAALAAPIAATTRASVAPYATASSLYTPDTLKTYLAGTQNLNTSTTGGSTDQTPINSPAYVPPTSKKDASLAGVA